MPTYEYRCDACGHQFERQQKMSDRPVRTCPECGKTVRRLISAVAGFVRRSAPPPSCKSCRAAGDGGLACDRRSCEERGTCPSLK